MKLVVVHDEEKRFKFFDVAKAGQDGNIYPV